MENEGKQAQSEMMETIMENILPMVQPMIKPAAKKLTEFMNDGNMIIIRAVKGDVVAFHIKSADVDRFEFKEGKSPVNTYNIDELISGIIGGKFSI